jgi:hypothetical protein
MFVAGFQRMAPYAGSDAMLNNLLEANAAELNEAFRIQWQRRCEELIPNG